MTRIFNQYLLIASLCALLTFYFLFWMITAICLCAAAPWNVYSIPIAIGIPIYEAVISLPLTVLVGFPSFLASLAICDALASRPYLSVASHAVLAVPLSGLILASSNWGGPGFVEDWHDIVWLAARWSKASLPSGAIAGFASWALRQSRAHPGL